ncbi:MULTISPECIES: divergent polysaccharide deacetylase family protein [unclassified Sinorhizobium]|uniref:divergent polysaccharide deacetylase family protein n=1 Tax=unclassified Sinorhizobium TaxID=2613772 RepID=UPI0024C3BCBC|nr:MULTISPECIES: divergent polysaccharide deacetylase family protein [unclassified Sinorhizobium]MDK1375844.1 divergent polysaccharide deacetylase family protein [Sinorhizobium sp. 6-70]MDK1481011.1 divergent polysaccharide deacetylase family protein [Sinorhizobium sp. 6-117]
MGTDLNAPLGQNRKVRPARRRDFRSSLGYTLISLGAATVVGLSAWSALSPDGLTHAPEAPELASKGTASAGETPATAGKADAAGRRKSPLRPDGALSGAHVEEMLTNDGATVTKYTPRSRESDGPAFINVGAVRGQDPRMAALPNEDLLEDSPQGRLPITGPDGLRPMDQYARPWSGARGTRIALVLGGLGLSQTGTQRAIRDLPPEVTFAFAAAGNSLQRWMQDARRDGHEILLQIPMEPFDYPDNDPGPHALRVSLSATKNLAELHRSMGQITNYTGIMNYLGGRFLSDADALEPVMRDLGKRGLLFLDDGTSAQSLSGTLAGAFDVPHGFADVIVDSELSRGAILRKLDELERVARRNGTAIGVASVFEESVAAISEWMQEAGGRGIEFVGVSALVKDPQQK